ncbi:hypothetical protein BDV93DRAFT_516844 [Ceratobasidium sp. AG-I]|nr:hypothetical protein BDV93DRAFT_516844 [Ceratobasidium sp. AG-I]
MTLFKLVVNELHSSSLVDSHRDIVLQIADAQILCSGNAHVCQGKSHVLTIFTFVNLGCIVGLWWGTRSGLAYGVCGNSPWARVECRVLDMRQPLPKGQVPGVGRSVCLSYGVCTTAGGLGPGNSSYIGAGTAGCLRNIPMVVIGSTSDHTASAPLLEAL